MSDKFRKAFRLLLVCGRFNPARQSAAAAMAAAMATDRTESTARSNHHAIYYRSNNYRRHPSTAHTAKNRSNNITAFAMVEIPPITPGVVNSMVNNAPPSSGESQSVGSGASGIDHFPSPQNSQNDGRSGSMERVSGNNINSLAPPDVCPRHNNTKR